MNWLLEQAQPNSTLGMTASADFFDSFGVLLLLKGQRITKSIRELLEKRQVYIWVNQEDQGDKLKKQKHLVY